MVKKIRFSIANSLFKDKESLKAIAFALFLYHVHGSNVVKRWTRNKLAAMTGVHVKTIEKRVNTLLRLGYAKTEGSSLVLLSIVSKHSERNIKIMNICYDSLKDVEKSLYAVLLCIIQSHKDFCKRTILQAQNSRRYNDVKNARATQRRYGYGSSFCDFGLSYRRIAQKMGVSLKTAFMYVKYAVEKGFVAIQRHFLATFMPNVKKYPVPGYKFTTDNYAYSVEANTYTIMCDIFGKGTACVSRARKAWY